MGTRTPNRGYYKPGDGEGVVGAPEDHDWTPELNANFDSIDAEMQAVLDDMVAAQADIITAQAGVTSVQAGVTSVQADITTLEATGVGILSYTIGTLPAPGTPGRIVRLTDGIRGLWTDTGTGWRSITGVCNVKDFGAKGDSIEAGTSGTDDSAAVQAAFTAAAAWANGITAFFPSGYYRVTSGVTCASDSVSIEGAGKYSSYLVGAGSGVDTLTIASSSYHMENFTMQKMAVTGSVAGRYAVAIGGTTVSQGLTQAAFRSCRIHTLATANRAFYCPSRVDFDDIGFYDCSFSSSPSATSTSDAVIYMAGYGSVNNIHFEGCRVHTNNSPVTKGLVVYGDVSFPNWWHAAIAIRDMNFEQPLAGAMAFYSCTGIVLENVQIWDPVGAWTGSQIELYSMGGSTITQGVSIRNYWTANYTAANRGTNYDIKIIGAKNVTIDTPNVQSLTEKLRIDAGSCTGLVMLNVPSDSVVDNLPTRYVWTDNDGVIRVGGGLQLRDFGSDVPSGGTPGTLLGVGTLGASKVLYGNDEDGALSYVAFTKWVFSSTDVPGLVAWFKADAMVADGNATSDGDAVAAWKDQSATAVNAVQATAGNKPLYKTNILNGKPVVRFNGTTGFLSLANPIAAGANRTFTVFVVSNRTSQSAVYRTLLDLGGTTAATGYLLMAGLPGGDELTPWYGYGDAALKVGPYYSSGFTPPVGTAYRISCSTMDPAAEPLFVVDGVKRTSGTFPNPTITTLATAYIGANAGTSRFFDQDIAEILIFSGALTRTQRQTVNGYLGAKYGITVGTD